MTDSVRGTLRWDYKQPYDHARYMRLWRLRRRGGMKLFDTSGKHRGFIEQKDGYFKLFTTEGRKWE